MVGSINKVILVGNLGADPKVANTANGAKIVNLNVATSDSWKDKLSGERKERTEWHRVVIFNSQLLILPKDICVKGLKFIWKVLSRPADGKITTARKNTQPKLCCRTSPATWCCLMVAAMAFLPAATMSSPVRLPIPDGITPRRLLLLLIWTMIFRSKL